MKALRKDPIHKKIMATRDDHVNNDKFDQDEATAVSVEKRKFLLKQLLEDKDVFQKSESKNGYNYEKLVYLNACNLLIQ